jgi:hypothetical protein
MVENDERKTYIKELTDRHSKRELDEIARALGLNPSKYPTKKEVANAILTCRELTEQTAEKSDLNRFPTDEVLEVEKLAMSSVRTMIKAAENKAGEFKAYYAGEFNQGVKAFHDAVGAFEKSIEEQTKKNDDFVKKEFSQNLKTFHQSIEAFKQSIIGQMKENQEFIKQFYG